MSESKKTRGAAMRRAAAKAAEVMIEAPQFPVCAPSLMPGVAPKGVTPPVMAMDSSFYDFANQNFPGGGFPGFAYLAGLATRAEYRAFASSLSTELTRKWIKLTSKAQDGSGADRIKEIEAEFTRLGLRGIIQRAAEHDCLFGRAQILVDVDTADRSTPLIISPRTIPVGAKIRVVTVEASWTTPAFYNSIDPTAPDFFVPSKWFVLGQEVHASRLLTVITRPLPDILKPAFNFAGMSLSQLAQPYVENWLRTRQSVSDLLNNFSITGLKTTMDQVLSGEDGSENDLFARATLFTATRSNRGLMLLDNETEDIVQINTPLSGLHELQAQAQEHMCSVSRTPAIVLTGISPSGLNASSDGEIRVYYDWIAAQQEAFWRQPLETILQIVQLSKFGEIDESICIEFVPLYQLTEAEKADIRAKDAQTAATYIGAGVIDPSEERERLASATDSGYHGIDASMEIVPPESGLNAEGS